MEHKLIQIGDFVIVQRQGYTKLHKIKAQGTITLGKDILELEKVIGHNYYTTFRMVLKSGGKRRYGLDKVTELTTTNRVNLKESGIDNRSIIDDGHSQALTKEQIENLRDQARSSSDIVGQLIANSKTFNTKTEYAQEKYLKKKEKKYFEFIQIRKPTIRLLAQLYYRQEPGKILGLRIDDLSQILTCANVQANGNYLLYDSGSSGLVPASILNAIGADTPGILVHAHPGNECQKNALLAMQFSQEQLERCVHVNLYSVLRCFHQTLTSVQGADSPPPKKPKTDKVEMPKQPCWQIENEKACNILSDKMHGLVIVSKEHPINIAQELIGFLKPGCNLVVYNIVREPLQDLYFFLKKSRTDFINIRVSSNFMRNYQVLPDRTHPEVTMNSGGYILSAVKLDT